MPYRIRTVPSGEIVLLDQVIASARGQLDGFAGDDPAAVPLREHLDQLTARRDMLLRAQEDNAYAWNRGAIWVGLFLAVGGLAMAAGGLAGLAGVGRDPLAVKVVFLAGGAFLMMMGFPLTIGTWSDIREYRRTHPETSSRTTSGSSGPQSLLSARAGAPG